MVESISKTRKRFFVNLRLDYWLGNRPLSDDTTTPSPPKGRKDLDLLEKKGDLGRPSVFSWREGIIPSRRSKSSNRSPRVVEVEVTQPRSVRSIFIESLRTVDKSPNTLNSHPSTIQGNLCKKYSDVSDENQELILYQSIHKWGFRIFVTTPY